MDDPDEPTVLEVREQAQAYFEAAAAYQSRMLEASSGYNQIVVLGGYAGFFTIWSGSSDQLPAWLVLSSGALMGVSLTIYVAWTVYGMVVRSNHMQRMMNEIGKGPVDFLPRVQATEAKSAIAVHKYMRFWRPVIWAASVPALIAACLLAAGAFCSVVASSGQTIVKPAVESPASPLSPHTGRT